MNRYICFYRGKSVEVETDTSYQAQTLAAQYFKAKRQHEVHVMLTEKNGEHVTHSTSSM